MEKKWVVQSLSLAFVMVLWAFVALPGALAITALGQVTGPPPGIDPAIAAESGGYPKWLQDATGLQLELCLDNNDFCAPLAGGEQFYWSATADAVSAGITGLLVLAWEAAYGGVGDVVNGQQIIFARLRILADVTAAGTYTVTHPYGQNTFVVDAVIPGPEINLTEDIGAIDPLNVEGGFQGILRARVTPALTWPNFATDPLLAGLGGVRYVGDGATPHVVAGSPTATNSFTITGPAGTATTDLFIVMGKAFESLISAAVTPWTFPAPPAQKLVAVGPVNRTTRFNPASTAVVTGALAPAYPVGFPMWYEDINVLRLTHCPAGDAKCIADPDVDPVDPVLNIGAEAFFWSSDAIATGAGINGLLVMALEEAWGGGVGDPTDGDGNQIIFQRLRIRVDVPVAGIYTVTHPFGMNTFEVLAADVGIGAINFTDDIGSINAADPDLAMRGALSGQYDRFLTWSDYQTDPTLFNALTGTRYIGDPNFPHIVTGSPTGNNIFRIAGPGGISAETDLFSAQGKVFGTVATAAVAVTVPPQPAGLVVTPGTPGPPPLPAALTDPAAVVGAGDPVAGAAILTGPAATAPAGFTPVAATTFTATGLPVAPAAPGTATVALTFDPVPANPVFFNVKKGTGKFTKIFPTNAAETAAATAEGITNVSFNAGTRTLTFTIKDNAPADDNPA